MTAFHVLLVPVCGKSTASWIWNVILLAVLHRAQEVLGVFGGAVAHWLFFFNCVCNGGTAHWQATIFLGGVVVHAGDWYLDHGWKIWCFFSPHFVWGFDDSIDYLVRTRIGLYFTQERIWFWYGVARMVDARYCMLFMLKIVKVAVAHIFCFVKKYCYISETCPRCYCWWRHVAC